MSSSVAMDSSSSDFDDIMASTRRAVYFLQKRKNYRYVQHVSRGGYGVVVNMYDDLNRIPIAVKCTDDPSHMELKKWKSFKHSNIVPLLDMFMLDCCVIFIMPLYRKDMWEVCDEKFFYKDPLSYDLSRVWFKDVLRGLSYLHSRSFSHLDLKLDNIFLKDNGHACIGDFSLMTKIDKVDRSSPFLEHFQPPEFTPYYEEITGSKLDDDLLRGDRADVWEFGVFVVDMLTDRKVAIEKNSSYEMWKFDVYPYLEKLTGNITYMQHVLETEFKAREFTFEDVALCHNFVLQLLNISPAERVSVEMALRHPFVDVTWPKLSHPGQHSPVLLEVDDELGVIKAGNTSSEEAIQRLTESIENLFGIDGNKSSLVDKDDSDDDNGYPGIAEEPSSDATTTAAALEPEKEGKPKKVAKDQAELFHPKPVVPLKHKQGVAAADARPPKKEDANPKK